MKKSFPIKKWAWLDLIKIKSVVWVWSQKLGFVTLLS